MLWFKKNMEEDSDLSPKTHWYSIYICTAFAFFDGIQYAMFFVSMWPYLNKIDPFATATFFGFITASFSLGQAISGPVFGFWMNKAKTVKPPLTLSLIMMMISNLTYTTIEVFPQSDRRFIMLATRFVIGLAAGDVVVHRAYSISACVPRDRAKAIAWNGAAWTSGLTLGPAIPVIFSPLGYPGWRIFKNFHFDMYTAPAWVSLVNNILCFIVLHTVFKEVYVSVEDDDKPKDGEVDKTKTKINKFAVIVCIVSRFCLLIVFTNNETIGSIFTMAMYNWSNAQAVKY